MKFKKIISVLILAMFLYSISYAGTIQETINRKYVDDVASSASGDFANGGESDGIDRTLGNTDNYDLSFLTNNQSRLHIQNDGKVGIGTSSPSGDMELIRSAKNTSNRITTYSDKLVKRPFIIFKKSHSDVEWTDTETLDGENLGTILWQAFTSTNSARDTAKIEAIQDGSATSSRVPTNLYFEVYGTAGLWSNQLVLHNDGLIGMNTDSPTSSLTIKGQGASSSTSSLNVTDTSGTSLLYVRDDGKVGIGTDSPAVSLDVMGRLNCDDIIFLDDIGATAQSTMYIRNYNATQLTYAPVISLRKSHSDTFETVTTSGGEYLGEIRFLGVKTNNTAGRGATIKAVQDGAAGTLFIPTKLHLNAYSLSGANVNQLVLASDGKVGIGTNIPNAKLDISGDCKISNDLTVEYASNVSVRTFRGETDTDITGLILHNADGEACYVYPNATQDDIIVSSTRP